MNHDDYRELLLLSISGPLEADESELLERHLATCADCRSEQAALRKFERVVRTRGSADAADEQLLQEARKELRLALRKKASRATLWQRMVELFSPSPRLGYALATASVFVIGILLGRTLWVSPTSSGTGNGLRTQESETKISGIRFLGPVSPSGEVEFTFDAVTPVHMKGNVEDPRIQKVLTHAMLNEENPGIRLRAVSVVSAPRNEPQDKEIKFALIAAVKNDPNDGVRKEALNALRRLPFDPDIKKALLQTLVSDRNPGLRIAAINGLDSTRSSTGQLDNDILEVLRQKANTDKNNYIRLKAQSVLAEADQR